MAGSALAIIGGTGLTSLPGLRIARREIVHTPWGAPSGPLVRGVLHDTDVVFLARHGTSHTIPPHRVNYRANVWSLKQIGIRRVIAVAAVGGIHEMLTPGRVAIPDQIVDYTYGRAHTFFEDDLADVVHVDFTRPYCATLRRTLLEVARTAEVDAHDGGTYAATQGPRLETAAEIDRLERDGCDMVGMTGMPEAGLAREAELDYVHCAVVANRAAGRGPETIAMDDVRRNVRGAVAHVAEILRVLLAGSS